MLPAVSHPYHKDNLDKMPCFESRYLRVHKLKRQHYSFFLTSYIKYFYIEDNSQLILLIGFFGKQDVHRQKTSLETVYFHLLENNAFLLKHKNTLGNDAFLLNTKTCLDTEAQKHAWKHCIFTET